MWGLPHRQVPGAVAETLIFAMSCSTASVKFQKGQGYTAICKLMALLRQHWSWALASVFPCWRCCGGIDGRLVCCLLHRLASRLLHFVGWLIHHVHGLRLCYRHLRQLRRQVYGFSASFLGVSVADGLLHTHLTSHSSRRRYAARLNSDVRRHGIDSGCSKRSI